MSVSSLDGHVLLSYPYEDVDPRVLLEERMRKGPLKVQVNIRPLTVFNMIHAYLFTLARELSKRECDVVFVVFDRTVKHLRTSDSSDPDLVQVFVRRTLRMLERTGCNMSRVFFTSESVIDLEIARRGEIHDRTQALLQGVEIAAQQFSGTLGGLFDVVLSMVYESYLEPDVLLTGELERQWKDRFRQLPTLRKNFDWFHPALSMYIPSIPGLDGRGTSPSDKANAVVLSDPADEVRRKLSGASAEFIGWFRRHFLVLSYPLHPANCAYSRAQLADTRFVCEKEQIAEMGVHVLGMFRSD
jgi:hypothetical protein